MKLIVIQLVKTVAVFLESENSLPCS